MRRAIDETHDQNLKSWVESANDPVTDFPIQNLPLCFVQDAEDWFWLGVRIGDEVVHLQQLDDIGVFDDVELALTQEDRLWTPDAICRSGPGALAAMRRGLQSLLRQDAAALRDFPALRRRVMFQASELRFHAPVEPANYTDFYASVHHATNVGSMFRPDNPLLPNYKWVPIGYHGRASSIVASGSAIRRPNGQTKADDADAPRFGPCRMLDHELEVGFVIGQGNDLGSAIPLSEAERHLLGICLVNDWSARDLQKWEYQPLGPFLAKSFATTVSPYIVTMEALAPFRRPVFPRPEGDPRPLPYLMDEHNEKAGGIELTLEVRLATAEMRTRGVDPVRISRGSFGDMYWTIAQMLTHHASNGCNLLPGDLMASGTVSGTAADARGCMLELTWDGPGKPRRPIELPTGEKRVFLEDGDEVILTGFCEREGYRRIGLGECRGVIAPAIKA